MYPPARRSDHVDTYFNTAIPDPYRWMEDVDSPEVEAWVTAQNTLTRSILDAVPGRAALHDRLLALTNFERVSAPIVRNQRFVYAHNTGLQNQAVLLWQDGPAGEPHLLLDPNTLSPDGTVALAGISLSPNGTHLAYALSEAGSDWITWHIREIGTGPENSSPNAASPDAPAQTTTSHDLPDRITRSKFSSASWLPDTSGFLYSGYGLPAPEAVISTEAASTTAVIPTGAPTPAAVTPPEAASTTAVISTEAQPTTAVISTEAQRTTAVISTEAQRSGEIPSLQSPDAPAETDAPAKPDTPADTASASTQPKTPDDLKATQHFHKVFLHTLGTPQSADPILYQRPDDGELLLGGHVTYDGRYLLLTASKGHTNQLHAIALDAHLRPTGPLIPIAPPADARYAPIDTDGDTLWLHTTSDAPNGRVLSINLANPARDTWQTILPETPNNLDSVSLVANTLIATYLADAQSQVHLFTPTGTPLGPLELPAIGTVSAFSGRRSDLESFVTFTNFTTPPTILRLDLSTCPSLQPPSSRPSIASGETPVFSSAHTDDNLTVTDPANAIFGCHSEAQPRNPRISPFTMERSDARSSRTPALPHLSQSHGEGWDVSRLPPSLTPFRSPRLTFNPTDFTTSQVFFTSKDGTRVPMFLTHRRGLALDGTNPTLLYAYGGFNISLLPTFSPSHLLWMELGGIFAQPNLRGGGEYGEAWHEAGTRLKKQNVFDDFIAAAEYLITNHYTSPHKLAIEGGSNGGLLVAAVELQRPDLFAAAIAHVGVFDMLRFDQFTIGYAWKPDYGSPSESEPEFRALLRYSPLHNTRPHIPYPPTLVLTADHDDRVFPAHSFKFTAAMQHALSLKTAVISTEGAERRSGENPKFRSSTPAAITSTEAEGPASLAIAAPASPLAAVISTEAQRSGETPVFRSSTPQPITPTAVEGPASLAIAAPASPSAAVISTEAQRSGETPVFRSSTPEAITLTKAPSPTLIRVEVRAGHGAGMPLAKRIDQTVDVYLFLARFLQLNLPE